MLESRGSCSSILEEQTIPMILDCYSDNVTSLDKNHVTTPSFSSTTQIISDLPPEIPNTSSRPSFFVDPTDLFHTRSPSLVYLKPCFITPKQSIYDNNEELYQLYCDDSYPTVAPFSLVDENGVCYAALPHGRTIDLSSLYYKGNGSPSIFDLQETQSPKEKRIAKVVMAVAIILLTMCVVLVGVTLSMSGYIDAMVRELHSKRNANSVGVNDPISMLRFNDTIMQQIYNNSLTVTTF